MNVSCFHPALIFNLQKKKKSPRAIVDDFDLSSLPFSKETSTTIGISVNFLERFFTVFLNENHMASLDSTLPSYCHDIEYGVTLNSSQQFLCAKVRASNS